MNKEELLYKLYTIRMQPSSKCTGKQRFRAPTASVIAHSKQPTRESSPAQVTHGYPGLGGMVAHPHVSGLPAPPPLRFGNPPSA